MCMEDLAWKDSYTTLSQIFWESARAVLLYGLCIEAYFIPRDIETVHIVRSVIALVDTV